MEISGNTRVFAVIGNPARHSLSPLVHNTSFRELGIDAVYLAHEFPASKLKAAFAGFRALGYSGINVTMPYKAAVIPFLDELSPAAALMGAVNTITFVDGRVIGHNTDGGGLLAAIEASGFAIPGATMTIIGLGGAGSAILTQAALDGVGKVFIHNRMPAAGSESSRWQEHLAKIAHIQDETGVIAELFPLVGKDDAALAAHVQESSIVIDASSVGMGELVGQANVAPGWLHANQCVAEVVYHPPITPLIEYARGAGATVVDGLDMLIGQAALSEKIWLNVDMPVRKVTQRLALERVPE